MVSSIDHASRGNFPEEKSVRLIPLLFALLAACGSCAHFADYRTAKDQYAALVKIETVCFGNHYGGSGTLVGPDEVLTANHVTVCELAPGTGVYMQPKSITVWVTDTENTTAVVDASVPGADLARLHLKKSFGAYFTDLRVGSPPSVGDTVCEVSAEPRPTYRCGPAQDAPSGYIRVDFMVEHGNSGSPIYNSKGEIVGVITNLIPCERNQLCAGFGTALAGYAWIVP